MRRALYGWNQSQAQRMQSCSGSARRVRCSTIPAVGYWQARVWVRYEAVRKGLRLSASPGFRLGSSSSGRGCVWLFVKLRDARRSQGSSHSLHSREMPHKFAVHAVDMQSSSEQRLGGVNGGRCCIGRARHMAMGVGACWPCRTLGLQAARA